MLRRATYIISELKKMATLKAAYTFTLHYCEAINSSSSTDSNIQHKASSLAHSISIFVESRVKTLWSEFVGLICMQGEYCSNIPTGKNRSFY